MQLRNALDNLPNLNGVNGEWCEWIKSVDKAAPFPNSTEVLGGDLGPDVDIGPAVTRKILKANGGVVHQSAVRSLNKDEINGVACIKEVDESAHERLGPACTEIKGINPGADSPHCDCH